MFRALLPQVPRQLPTLPSGEVCYWCFFLWTRVDFTGVSDHEYLWLGHKMQLCHDRCIAQDPRNRRVSVKWMSWALLGKKKAASSNTTGQANGRNGHCTSFKEKNQKISIWAPRVIFKLLFANKEIVKIKPSCRTYSKIKHTFSCLNKCNDHH